jgi:hypothetical protein
MVMTRSHSHVARLLMTAIITVSVCGIVVTPVSAGPITGPIWDIDTPTAATVRFTGEFVAPLPNPFFSSTSPSGFWNIAVRFDETHTDALETVLIDGYMQHLFGPHVGEFPGELFHFTLVLIPPRLLTSVSDEMDHCCGFHHVDSFFATAFGIPEPSHEGWIESYSFLAAMRHTGVPEPTTVVLLGAGLAGVAAYVRQYRNQRSKT